MDFVGTATPLAESDINEEAQELGCEPAAIWAVCDVESANSGFLPDGRPQILFEAHSFHTLTGGRYDRSYPNISSPIWDRSLYGHSGVHQYDRLAVAVSLDRAAALESASWGRFQIMGSNYKICGYADIESFVSAMMESEKNHLSAFGNFCRANRIVSDLISHDWSHFALRYNGSGQVSYYADKLAAAYQRHLSQNTAPDGTPSVSHPAVGSTLRRGDKGPAVVALQNDLLKLGYDIGVDGDFGRGTEEVVKEFQQKYNTAADGIVGPNTQSLIALAIANL